MWRRCDAASVAPYGRLHEARDSGIIRRAMTAPTTPPQPPRLVLIGMMASGKSRVGRLLAAHLGWAFWDNDEELLATAGRDAHAIFASDGPDEVHRLEARVLQRALGQPRAQVICAPASSVLSPASAQLLSNEWVVWLRARPETLAQRAGGDTALRPYLSNAPLAMLTDLAATRDPGFSAISDITVDVDELSPTEVVARIVELMPASLRNAAAPSQSVESSPTPTPRIQ